MPYIDWSAQRNIDAGAVPNKTGELTYALTRVATEYLETVGLSFAHASEVITAFECAKLEFYRRVLAPYEDAAIARNGDVYPPALLGQRPKVD